MAPAHCTRDGWLSAVAIVWGPGGRGFDAGEVVCGVCPTSRQQLEARVSTPLFAGEQCYAAEVHRARNRHV